VKEILTILKNQWPKKEVGIAWETSFNNCRKTKEHFATHTHSLVCQTSKDRQ